MQLITLNLIAFFVSFLQYPKPGRTECNYQDALQAVSTPCTLQYPKPVPTEFNPSPLPPYPSFFRSFSSLSRVEPNSTIMTPCTPPLPLATCSTLSRVEPNATQEAERNK